MVVYVEFPFRCAHSASVDVKVAWLHIRQHSRSKGLLKLQVIQISVSEAQGVAAEEGGEDVICAACGSTGSCFLG